MQNSVLLEMTMITTLEELENLGNPDLIAEELHKQSFGGQIGDKDYCPMAIFVFFHYPNNEITYIVRMEPHHYIPVPREGQKCVEFPPNISEFVRRFDAGKYPKLIKQV